MKVLAISDEIRKEYYDDYRPGILDDFDLIISCGDLPKTYLEFLVTMVRVPLVYVHGNHDDSYLTDPPGGCTCIEDRIFEYQGLRFLGLGGSYRYRPDGNFMYSEREMSWRIRKLWYPLRKKGGFDILVTHAPAFGCGDLDTLPHRGFRSFTYLMDKYQPLAMIHGHVHRNYGSGLAAQSHYKGTRIINAFGKQILDL